jgi:hypothetical protein
VHEAPPLEDVVNSGRTQSIARTGEHCPSSGWWTDANAPNREPTMVYVAEGSLMPAIRGEPRIWTSAHTVSGRRPVLCRGQRGSRLVNVPNSGGAKVPVPADELDQG